MFTHHKTSFNPQQKMIDLIMDNPSLLLMLQHFDIDFRVKDKTVAQICEENHISVPLFVAVGNLYNGFQLSGLDGLSKDDIHAIVRFLRNSHNYYRHEKYPQIDAYIQQLYKGDNEKEIRLIQRFFDEYFKEVTEHLDYEDDTAFVYFLSLNETKKLSANTFSALEYSTHHTDIESKLSDLKNLLLKHIPLKADLSLRRKLLCALFELEFDLYIHSLIEERILIPLGKKIETSND